jgi:hypothetical protein
MLKPKTSYVDGVPITITMEWGLLGLLFNKSTWRLQERWKRDFKLSYFQFFELLDMLKLFIQKKGIGFRNAILTTKALAMVIHRLAFGGAIWWIRDFLGVGLATTSKYIHMICEALVDNFYDKYTKTTEVQQLETIMVGLEKITNIPYM